MSVLIFTPAIKSMSACDIIFILDILLLNLYQGDRYGQWSDIGIE